MAAPAPLSPPAHPWCRSVTEGMGTLGQVSAPSALPWPHRGLPEHPGGAGAAPDLCEASSSLSSFPPRGGGGKGAHMPPIPKGVHCRKPPAALAPIEGVPYGAGSSNAAPLVPPARLARKGPVGIAHGLQGARAIAQPSSTLPAVPAVAEAGGGDRQWAPVARRRPAPVRPCPRHTWAPPPRPPAGAKEEEGVKAARRPGRPPARLLSPHPSTNPARHRGVGGEPGGGGTLDSGSVKEIAEKTSHMGRRASLASAVGGGIATRGAGAGGGGGWG